MKGLSRELAFSRVLIFFLLIIGLSVLYVFHINTNKDLQLFLTEEGYLDLRDWDMKGLVSLDGQWEVYPDQLLEPGDPFIKPSYQLLPGPSQGMKNPRFGSVTYRLLVDLPRGIDFGFELKNLRQASRIYLDGRLVSSQGQVAQNFEEFEAGVGHQTLAHTSKEDKLEILIQLSSFSYRRAGIMTSIRLGRLENLLRLCNRARFFSGLAIIIGLVLGLYFILNYLVQPSQDYLVYIGFTYIFISLHLSVLDEEVFRALIDYPYAAGVRIEFFSLLMTGFFLSLSIHSLLEDYALNGFMRFLFRLFLLASLSLSLPFEKLLPMVEALHRGFLFLTFTLAYCYIFYLVGQVIRKRGLYYRVFLILALYSAYFWLLKSLEFFFDINFGFIQLIIMVLIFLGLALFLGHTQYMDKTRLKKLSKKLENESEIKNIFLGLLSRQMKEPLDSLREELMVLSEGRLGPLSSQQQMKVYKLNQELTRLNRISDEILVGAESSSSLVKLRPLDPCPIIEDLSREMEVFSKEGVRFLVDLPASLPLVLGDYDYLVQILYSLLANALENTYEGEVRLEVDLIASRMVFTIKDQGEELSKEELESIFELFHRSQMRKSPGLGLGLSIANYLVEAQGGSLGAAINPNGGLTFSFSMDIFRGSLLESQEKLDRPVEFSARILQEKRDFRILLHGLSPSCQREIKSLLSSGPFRVLIGKDESHSLQLINEGIIDLLLVDYAHIRQRQEDFITIIRSEFSLMDLPILVLVSLGFNMSFMDLLEGGASDYLKKPLDSQEFLSRLESLLHMKLSVEDSRRREFKYSYLEISPHFLHNTLNTIMALSYEDGAKTRRAIRNLSMYFRGKLSWDDRSLIPLEEEVKLVRAYLEIEKMRFEKLEVILDIDKELTSWIPPLSLQPLVENALTHGLRPKRGLGWVKIKIKEEDDLCRITIEDNGVGMSEKKRQELMSARSLGLGFSNVLSKFRLIEGASLDLFSKRDQGTRIEIIMPRLEER